MIKYLDKFDLSKVLNKDSNEIEQSLKAINIDSNQIYRVVLDELSNGIQKNRNLSTILDRSIIETVNTYKRDLIISKFSMENALIRASVNGVIIDINTPTSLSNIFSKIIEVISEKYNINLIDYFRNIVEDSTYISLDNFIIPYSFTSSPLNYINESILVICNINYPISIGSISSDVIILPLTSDHIILTSILKKLKTLIFDYGRLLSLNIKSKRKESIVQLIMDCESSLV